MVTSALSVWVGWMSAMYPILDPASRTSLPLTRPSALGKTIFMACELAPVRCGVATAKPMPAMSRIASVAPMTSDLVSFILPLSSWLSSVHSQWAFRRCIEELVYELVVGGLDFFLRAEVAHLALVENADVVREATHGTNVVAHHDRRCLVFRADFTDQVAEQRGTHRIEAGIRLIEEEDLRFHDKRSGEAGALAHATAQFVGHPLFSACQADLHQVLHHDLAHLTFGLVRVLAQRKCNIVEKVHRREQRAVLEQHADTSAEREQLKLVELGHVLAVHEHVAAVGRKQTHDVPERHALSRSRRSHQPRDLTPGEAT